MNKSRLVLDTSIVMAWCLDDESNPYADAVLGNLTSCTALAPAIWPLEVGNVLQVAQRKKRLDQASALRFLNLLKGLPIVVEAESPNRMLQEIYFLAGEQGLSTYDASYLDLAMRLNLPLATLDQPLAQAALRVGVSLFSV